jgi:two-component system, LytTR family, sensor kinase
MSRINWRRELQFWMFQLAGWSVWIVMLVLRDMTFVPSEYILERVSVFVVDALIGMALTTALRYLYRAVWELAVYIRVLAVFGGCWIASQAWRPIKVLITDSNFGSSVDLTDYGWATISVWLPVSMSLLLIWSVLYFFLKYYQLFQKEKEKSLRSESLAHEAQLRMLRYQLNPHFLFNTLNAISTLILVQSTDQANAMVTRLSKFLRYSLEHDPLDKVSLEHEISSLNLYLDIEKVRFEERLHVDYDLQPGSHEALVPSMLLQPLVENAIKYAIARSESGGTIWIAARRCQKDSLCITVADDGPGATDHPTSIGVGLKNIRDRLQEMYGDNYTLTSSPREPRGFQVTVIMPYETR